jgi:hypothetical protein
MALLAVMVRRLGSSQPRWNQVGASHVYISLNHCSSQSSNRLQCYFPISCLVLDEECPGQIGLARLEVEFGKDLSDIRLGDLGAGG